MTMAPLAARRLAEMVELGRASSRSSSFSPRRRVISVASRSAGTREPHASSARLVPFLGEGDLLPDLEPLVELVRTGRSRR